MPTRNLGLNAIAKTATSWPFWAGVAVVVVGLLVGLIAGAIPSLLILGMGCAVVLVCLLTHFEQTIIGLIILEGSTTVFHLYSELHLGLALIAICWATIKLAMGRPIYTDWFWWCFCGWVMLQGLWIILLPLGGLGLDGTFFASSLQEWIRLFSLLMIYLLVMQLKDRISPQKLLTLLFLSLIGPVTVGLLQMFVPSILPSFLLGASSGFSQVGGAVTVSRVAGTFKYHLEFAYYLVLFIALTWWKVETSSKRRRYLLLLGVLTLLLAGTKSLTGLVMFAVMIMVIILPKLNPVKLISGFAFVGVSIALFGNSPYGQKRFEQIFNTPLLNPDIDVSRAILLQETSFSNSFNWRLGHWYHYISLWRDHPLLGFGLGSGSEVSGIGIGTHSVYIQVLVETGLIGIFLFLLFLLAHFIRLFFMLQKVPQNSDQFKLCLVLLALNIAILLGMFTDNVFAKQFLFHWWIVLAIAGWNWGHQRTQASTLGLQSDRSVGLSR